VSLSDSSLNQLIKPTVRTKFHIDFDWWQREGHDFRVDVMSHLCADHRAQFEAAASTGMVDLVDSETAEVTAIDEVHYALRTHCARLPEFTQAQTTLVDAVFRAFLANGNQPLTPEELAEQINRPSQAQTILRTLSGRSVFKGIRPVYHADAD
jgi:hypothetical protein